MRSPHLPALLLLTCVTLSGCAESEPALSEIGFPQASTSSPERIGELWLRSCAFCHVNGNAGAPLIGDMEVWRPRLTQGREVLLQNTVNGLGNMPPLGYCMACEKEDFLALIDMMTLGLEDSHDE